MKKNILSLGLGLCLTLALSISASAAEYTFEGVENKEFYHSTSYSAMYGSNYNYGGINVSDYARSELPYGVLSNTSVGAMERVRILESNGYVSLTPITGGVQSGNGGSVMIPGIGEVYDPAAPSIVAGTISNPLTIKQTDYPLIYQKTAFTSVSGMKRSDGSIGTIKIPAVKINMKVWEGETNESMSKGVAHYSSTSSWDGNIGLCSHNRGSAYSIGAIKDLKLGDTITYTTVYGTRSYSVSYVGTISNTDWSYLQATADNRITITTCLANQPSVRVVVQATEIK